MRDLANSIRETFGHALAEASERSLPGVAEAEFIGGGAKAVGVQVRVVENEALIEEFGEDVVRARARNIEFARDARGGDGPRALREVGEDPQR